MSECLMTLLHELRKDVCREQMIEVCRVSYQAIRTESWSEWIWPVGLGLWQHDGFRHDRGHPTPLVGGTRS